MRNNIIIVLMLLGLTFPGTSVVLADLNNGLVAYYPFNGNANDESGNGNNGTVNGATLTTDSTSNTTETLTLYSNTETEYFNGTDWTPAAKAWVHSWWTNIEGAEWIWESYLVKNPSNAETVNFRKTFTIPNNVNLDTIAGTIKIAVDNSVSIKLNGSSVGEYMEFRSTKDFDISSFLVSGQNTLNLSVTNYTNGSSSPYDNPAGVIFAISIKYSYVTTPTSPTVTTKSATNVNSNSASLNGTVNANGGTTTAWFEYGATSGTYSSTTSTQTISSGWSDTSVTTDISGLSSKTTYYFRLVAQNSVGTTYGSELSFATTAPPTVTTSSATNVTMISATLNGTVNANGTSTTAWFEYGKTSGAYDKTTTTQSVSGSSDTSVSIYVSGLSSGTGYYYRLVAQNNAGVSYGSENSFTTITSSTPVPTPTPVSSDGDIVIYDTDIDGDWNIYKSDLGGINSIQLTNDLAEDHNPQISFNKTKIAFRSTRSSSRTDIWIMNIDGSNQVRLTSSGSDEDFYPRWSTDDTKLTFSAYRPYGTGGRIMLINADGTGEKELYYKSGYDSYAAGFINNNTKVIFLRQVRYCGGDATLMSIGIDGSNPTEIINISDLIGVDGGEVNRWGGPQVNQEENKVVFEYEYCDGKNFIYKIGVDGSGLQMLVDSTNDPISPNWTSDDRIVYSTINSMTNKFELWIMDSDGSNNKLLISNEKANFKFGSLIVTATQIPTPSPTPTPTTSPAPTLPPLPTPQVSPSPVQGGVVLGFVYDENEDAMRDVTVTIVGANGRSPLQNSTETDGEGYYEFTGLATGDYTLTYEKEGYITENRDVSLEGDETVVDVDDVFMEEIQKGSIYGYVVDIRGAALEKVKLKLKGVKTKVTKTASSDRDGFFEFEDLDPDTYRVAVTKKFYKKVNKVVKLEEGEDKEIEIEMKKTSKRVKEIIETGQ